MSVINRNFVDKWIRVCKVDKFKDVWVECWIIGILFGVEFIVESGINCFIGCDILYEVEFNCI